MYNYIHAIKNAIMNVKELEEADNIWKYNQGSQGVLFMLDGVSWEDDLEMLEKNCNSGLWLPQLNSVFFFTIFQSSRQAICSLSTRDQKLF